jgi:Tol biopolymer transport system component
MKTRRSTVTLIATLSLLVLFAASFASAATAPFIATDGATIRVSVASNGTESNRRSFRANVSDDGRFVAFASSATNLVPDDTAGIDDIFVHALETGATTRISVDGSGAQANGSSDHPKLSSDGRYVAFDSTASNLVPGDTNGAADVFVHDRTTGETVRVSVASDGKQANDWSAYWFAPSISADGCYVAYFSLAGNLVPDDIRGYADVFVHDLETSKTVRVSVASDGTEANNNSEETSISANGRYVAFSSDASNLIPGGTNGTGHIFVHDLKTGETTLASLNSNGSHANGPSRSPRISGDGRFVAFTSYASNLVPNDTNSRLDIFVHNRATGETTRVSIASEGAQGNHASFNPSIATNGRFVAFSSEASNLVAGDTNGIQDIFVHDRATGQTTLVSIAADGTQGNGISALPSISANGRHVAFQSDASNLVPDDMNVREDVFIHDRYFGHTWSYLPFISTP